MLHMLLEVSMEDVRTLRWAKTCSRCGAEMSPGTELVVDSTQVGPRGGKVFCHANPGECARANPRAKVSTRSEFDRQLETAYKSEYDRDRRMAGATHGAVKSMPSWALAEQMMEAQDDRAAALARRQLIMREKARMKKEGPNFLNAQPAAPRRPRALARIPSRLRRNPESTEPMSADDLAIGQYMSAALRRR